jgi:hypothetical protein
MTNTLFRLTALAWFLGALARPVMFLTDAFSYSTAPGASLASNLVGAAVGLAVGAALWLRPGRGAAVAGVLFGLYIVPTLLLLQIIGTPPWLIVLAGLSVLALVLSVACLWMTRSGTPG